MKKMSFAALSAAATLFASPFRLREPEAAPTIEPPFVHVPRAIAGTVRADVTTDPKALIAQIQSAFEEFKTANDAALQGKADVIVSEKVDRISNSLTDLEKAVQEVNLKLTAAATTGAGAGGVPEDPEYSAMFAKFARSGDGERDVKANHGRGVRAAMTVGTPADGGYTAPVEWDRTITGRLKLISPIRQHAKVISITGPGFTKLFTERAIGSGWVGETASRPATTTPQFTALSFALGEIYANAAASQQLLDDSEIDIEAWLAGEIGTEFARQEGIAFLSGNGTNKPYGLLTFVTGAANAAVHPWGDIKTVVSGAAAAFTSDGVINAVYALPSVYTPNAKWFLNRNSLGAVRKLKDGQNNYIWQPSFQAGQPSTLAGYPVIDVPDMPDVAAGNIAATFGDMEETYLVIDRLGSRLLRDPYTNKPYVCFYVTKRVGGAVVNPDAMKAVKIAAS